MKRKYHLTIAQLIDRLSIVTLKSVKIPEHKKDYEKEAKLIMDDLDEWARENKIAVENFGKFVRAIQVNSVSNEMIWVNESKARLGEKAYDLLPLTHSLNSIRNNSMNTISLIINERKDLKTDYMDGEITQKFGLNFREVLE